jgi:hypothetical protein
MITQKLLEGQAYVTVILIPYMVYKTRKAFVGAINRPTSSLFVQSIARELRQVFNGHFEKGLAMTIATENIQPGEWRHPRRINMLALMAFFLDLTLVFGCVIHFFFISVLIHCSVGIKIGFNVL